MKPNLSERERLLRTLSGVYAMLLGFLFIQGTAGILLGVIGLLALATGLVGWCGIYALLGKSASPSAHDLPESDN